jgi:hypothetical protein
MAYLDIDLKEHLAIGFNMSDGFVVTYKGFPLWRTGEGLEQLEFKIYDPSDRTPDDPDCYMLQCKDSLGDYFYYGRFHDRDDLKEFLDDPFTHHEREQKMFELMFGGIK